MRRLLAFLLTISLVLAIGGPASAARPVVKLPVTFNGHPISFDVAPEIVNDRTFVPFRAIFEKMGAAVEYEAGTKTITATRGSTTVKLTIGNTTAYVNGEARTLSAAPYIKRSRTLIPLRFAGEAFGARVDYDPATTAISIVDTNWPKRGGSLNLALWNKPTGQMNPIITDDYYTQVLTSMMYDGLWRYDERFTPIPALAESWEWNDAGTKLTFYLRKDVEYHDGTPLLARDVVFTFKAIFHPKYGGPRNSGFEDVLGYQEYHEGKVGETAADFERGVVTPTSLQGLYAPDDYTVVFELKQPNAPFLFNVPYAPVDYKRYKDVPIQDWGSARDANNLYPNGTGAFKMDQYVEGQYVVFKANDRYWSGRPYVDQVIWRVVSPDVAVGEMTRGTLDYAEFTAVEEDSYKAMSHVKVQEFPDVIYQYMGYNTAKGPTADKRVRQAINYAIDRKSIIDNLMNSHASTMYGPVHPLTWAYTDDVTKYNYDLDTARQLLDEAGWKVSSDGIREKDGQRLKLRLVYPNTGNQVRIKTAPVVQQWLRQVGIDVELLGYDFATVLQKTSDKNEFDLFFLGFVLGNSDPDPTGAWDKAGAAEGGFNRTGWWTEQSEDLIARGKSDGDLETRMEIYQEWAQHWTEESPAFILYAVNTLIANNKRLQNFRPGPQGALWNLEELWVTD